MGGDIHVLVNCAGIQRRSPAVQFSERDWDDVRVPPLVYPHSVSALLLFLPSFSPSCLSYRIRALYSETLPRIASSSVCSPGDAPPRLQRCHCSVCAPFPLNTASTSDLAGCLSSPSPRRHHVACMRAPRGERQILRELGSWRAHTRVISDATMQSYIAATVADYMRREVCLFLFLWALDPYYNTPFCGRWLL